MCKPEFLTARQWAMCWATYINSVYELAKDYIMDTEDDRIANWNEENRHLNLTHEVFDWGKGFEIAPDCSCDQEEELADFLYRVDASVHLDWGRLSPPTLSGIGYCFFLARAGMGKFDTLDSEEDNARVDAMIDRDFSEVDAWLACGEAPGTYLRNEYDEYLIVLQTYEPRGRVPLASLL